MGRGTDHAEMCVILVFSLRTVVSYSWLFFVLFYKQERNELKLF